MSKTSSYPRVVLFRRPLMIGAIVCVSIALAAGYIWIMTAHSIAPPRLIILDFLWKVFHWLRA